MAIRLHVTDAEIDAPEPDRMLEFAQGPVLLGRSRTNHVVFGGPLVSRVHFELHSQESGWVVLARGSLLPTILNGEHLDRERARPVAEGDRISVGGFTVQISLPRPPVSEAAPPSSEAWKVSPQESTWIEGRAGGEWRPPQKTWLEIVVESGMSAAAGSVRLPLLEEGREYVLGRSSDCDLSLQHGAVSRRHLRLRREGGEVVLTDLGSKNPARLDGVPVRGVVRMRVGTILQIGPLRLSLREAGGAQPAVGRSSPFEETAAWSIQDVAPPPDPVPPSMNLPPHAPAPSPAAPHAPPSAPVAPRSPAGPPPPAPPRAPAAPSAPVAPAALPVPPARVASSLRETKQPRPPAADEYAMTEPLRGPLPSSRRPEPMPSPASPAPAAPTPPPPAPPTPPRPPAPSAPSRPPAPPAPPPPPVDATAPYGGPALASSDATSPYGGPPLGPSPPRPARAFDAPRPSPPSTPSPPAPAPPRAPAAPSPVAAPLTPPPPPSPQTRARVPEPPDVTASVPQPEHRPESVTDAIGPLHSVRPESLPPLPPLPHAPAPPPAAGDTSTERLTDLFADPVRVYAPRSDVPVWLVVLVALLVIGAAVALWSALR